MSKYENAKPIDCTWTSDDQKYFDAANALANSLGLSGQQKHNRRNTLTLLINFTKQQKYYEKQYISVGKSEGFFRKLSSQINSNTLGITYTFIGVVNKARDHGLLEEIIGFRDPDWSSRLTRIKPTKRFVDEYITKYGLKSAILKRQVESIALRTAGKQIKTFCSTKARKEAKRQVDEYNEFISSQQISLSESTPPYEQAIDFDSYHLYRVFNNSSFKQGGRYYGAWWINLKRDLRPFIEINGQPTIEMDFQAQHIRFLYGLAGVQYDVDSDPYELTGYSRQTVKKAILTALNANDDDGAFKACLQELKADFGKDKSSIDYIINIDPVDTKIGYLSLVDAFIDKHPTLADYLHKGKGNYLMYLDSEVCRHILEQMTSKQLPVLPIHDSFIIRPQDRPELLRAASFAYQRVCPKAEAPLIEK